MSFIRATIEGRIGGDIELKEVQGQQLAKFSLAVDDYKGRNKETLWISVSVWGKLAELCAKYLSKGREVIVIGPVRPYSYTTKNGETKTLLECSAKEVFFIGSANGGKVAEKEESTESSRGEVEAKQISFEDIPF